MAGFGFGSVKTRTSRRRFAHPWNKAHMRTELPDLSGRNFPLLHVVYNTSHPNAANTINGGLQNT